MFRFLKTFVMGFFTLIGASIFSLIVVLIVMGLNNSFKKKENLLKDDLLLELNLKVDFTEAEPSFGFNNLINGPSQDFYAVLLAIKQAERDEKVKGMIIRGAESNLGLAQIQELRTAVLEFKKTGKPIWFHIDSFSEYSSNLKLYYLASAASKIVMQPMGSVTLQGLNASIPYFTRNLKKLGIKSQIIAREEYKDAYTSFTDEEMKTTTYESIKNLLDICFNHLIEGIVKERELGANNLIETMDQVCFINAAEALKIHLVDYLMYWDETVAMITKASKIKPKLISISKYFNSRLMKNAKRVKKDADTIALIYASGVIKKDDESTSPFTSNGVSLTASNIEESVDEILENPHIKCVVIRINSPGGSAIATDSISGQIKRLKDKKIPIVISMGNYAASGGYWIAALGDKIVANPLTITGSIGVIGGKFSIHDLLKKFDIPIGEISAGPNSNLASIYDDYNEKQWMIVQNSIENMYNNFIQVVATGRKLSTEHVRQVAKGRVWLGVQAKEFALVDELGGLTRAITLAKELGGIPISSGVPIVVYPRKRDIYDMVELWLNGDVSAHINIKNLLINSVKKYFTDINASNTLVYESTHIQ